MLFAQTTWQDCLMYFLIAAVGAFPGLLAYLKSRDNARAAEAVRRELIENTRLTLHAKEEVAWKVESVAKELKESTARVAENVAEKALKLAAQVALKVDEAAKIQSQKIEVLTAQTDGMKDDLVNAVRTAAFQAGVKSETDKKEEVT